MEHYAVASAQPNVASESSFDLVKLESSSELQTGAWDIQTLLNIAS